MLNKLEIFNLKSIDKASLKLAPLTILTGANSSGKSTVIQAIMLLIKHSSINNQYSMEELVRYLDEFSSIRNKKQNAKEVFIEAIDNNKESHTVSITINGVKVNSSLSYLYENKREQDNHELLYLNANRIGAQDLVPISERKVGILGEFLFSTFEKMKRQKLPAELVHFEGSKTIAYQLSQWLSFITCTPSELVTEKVSDQVKVAFKVEDLDSNISPFNLGAGMSYVSKVLIICLIAKKGDLILLENPEIQLHPKTQALLGVFLSFIASKGIQLIVETHCEHLINRIAYEIYEDRINTNDVVIHYKSSVSESFLTLFIDENGKFNDINGNVIGFPSGFFDATLNELMDMR